MIVNDEGLHKLQREVQRINLIQRNVEDRRLARVVEESTLTLKAGRNKKNEGKKLHEVCLRIGVKHSRKDQIDFDKLVSINGTADGYDFI